MRNAYLAGIAFLIVIKAASAQIDSSSSKRFFAYPVVFFAPETQLGFGAAGSFSFRFKNQEKNSYPSQISFGGAYTTNGQVLLYLPFRIYSFKHKLITYGEAGYYRYTYNFYGIGNEVPWNYTEPYKTYFTRLRMNALWQFSEFFHVGPRIWFEKQDIRRVEENGLLDSGKIPGSSGSSTPGFGVTINIDTRDNLFYPKSGWFAEIAWQTFQKAWQSSHTWSRYLADVTRYTSVSKRGVLAVNGLIDFNEGNPPFNLMAAFGGTRRMRGYYEGRFRDLKSLLIQTEYRNIIKGRFGYSLFASAGSVFDKLVNLDNSPLRMAAGAGLRFRIDRKEKLNLRLDFAFGRNSEAVYFTIGEAF